MRLTTNNRVSACEEETVQNYQWGVGGGFYQDELTVSTDNEKSCQLFFISLRLYKQKLHSVPHLANPMPILRFTKQTWRTTAHWPRGHFSICDVIRTWRILQGFVVVSHEIFAVEYYHFDYQFYTRIHLGNFLVVSYIKRSNSPLCSWVTAGE